MEKKVMFYLDGMTCGSCETRIEAAISGLDGVYEVKASFRRTKVEIVFDQNRISRERFIEVIEKQGYEVLEKPKDSVKSIVLLLILLFGGFYIIQNTIGFNFIPQVSEGMSYSLIFLVGLLTSVHCIAMCGGIALSQSVHSDEGKGKFMPSLLYNVGRVVSYTIVGGIVGGLGAVITPSGQFKGMIAIGAGVFMILLGLKMLNILHLPNLLGFRIPGISLEKIRTSNPIRPFIVGLFNGFMPCGPLQTMQLYALGTGSITKGALSMFFFSVGTVPLLFLFGAVTSIINGRLSRSMMKISAALVMVLGIVMLNRGLSLSGVALDFGLSKTVQNETKKVVVEDGRQVVNLIVNNRGYIPDVQVVQVGIPVKIKLDVQSINGCNNPIIIPEYGIEADLSSANPVMEFTPMKEGPIRITCWMGMITTRLTAVKNLDNIDNSISDNQGSSKGIWEIENKAAAARIDGNTQIIEMNVDGSSYSPNILVVQKGIPTRWVINVEEIDWFNSIVTIPDAGFVQPLKEGQNEIKFTPNSPGELTFTSGTDNFVGKIVIVNDLNRVNLKKLEDTIIEVPDGEGASCH
ncbi:urease accessory protein UreH domain-containing protein [Geosporobacter ferrireducens]|uniref:HMA domain-containing protein n=1 Tax=Geosporobacter ferrireducens TaxID=1424294 RepID=A0A1D8GE65_9FIRM|nr:sulfite exporter TauE/SafE family protein [Geosporobacter ferrireducens]AOT69189.1 hypothetical protein Gferi_06195 [Geosporobacter ferrireducens]